MSRETISTAIAEIRNETQQYGNTRARVADLLSQINAEKTDEAEVRDIIAEIMELAPDFVSYINGENFELNWLPVTQWEDGTAMTNAKADGDIYRKIGDNYFLTADYYLRGVVDLKTFGNTDTATNTTVAFKKAIAFMEAVESGVLLLPKGELLINEKITITKPFISIKGWGIRNTIIGCEAGAGLVLSSYADLSEAVVEDLELVGNNAAGSIGIHMPNTNNAYLSRVLVRHFDDGILGETAVMNKLTNVSTAACKRGITFKDGSYANVINNGRTYLCSEYGIGAFGSRVQIRDYNIEVCGIYNANTGKYEGGAAIKGDGAIEMFGLHIETTETAFLISGAGDFTIRDSNFYGCAKGIRTLNQGANINGKLILSNVGFTDVGMDIDAPNFSSYDVAGTKSFTAGGQPRALTHNLSEYFGVIQQDTYTANGFVRDIKTRAGATVNGAALFTGFKFIEAINYGTLAAGETKYLDFFTSTAINSYTSGVNVNLSNSAIPAGIILQASTAANDNGKVIITVSNISANPIVMGNLNTIITVIL